MKFSENSSEAADYLRLAVPKMVQHNIVPNPINYALWYSYYSNAFPELNIALDSTIERLGTCPQVVSEELFLSHITDFDGADDVDKIQQALMRLANDLSTSIDETTQSTAGHSNMLKHNLQQLATAEDLNSIDDISPIIKALASSAQSICDSNDKFQRQIESAKSEITNLKSELEDTKTEATRDHLTGLSNRRVFESIYHEFSEFNNDKDLALIMMDLDKFKVFNDTYGHNMGDQILKFVGKLLQKECAAPVTPVRFGGEEFSILCPLMQVEQAEKLAETLRSKLAKISFVNNKTGAKIPPITASFGVALRQKDENFIDIIERADTALYAAKSSGRNQVQISY